MATGRLLRSVLHNFLGTYTSRYSDYRGYWLFGYLVNDLDKVEFNLLTRVEPSDSIVEVARKLAVERFSEQLCKANLDSSRVRNAFLEIDRLNGQVMVPIDSRLRRGFNVQFRAKATTVGGRVFVCERVLFVAPYWEIHNKWWQVWR